MRLTEPIEHEQLASVAGCSISEFSRLFSYMAEMPVSEYIRRRRLTQAIFDIQNSSDKIIDIAIKYCYESPTAFTRAFKEMHGITPAAARKSKITLIHTPPLSFAIKPGMEGFKYGMNGNCKAYLLHWPNCHRLRAMRTPVHICPTCGQKAMSLLNIT